MVPLCRAGMEDYFMKIIKIISNVKHPPSHCQLYLTFLEAEHSIPI